MCGNWVASPGTSSASHINSSGVVQDSATSLQTKNSWMWLEGASFGGPQVPCLEGWEVGEAALRCLTERHQRIMFEGDSLVRNTFMGLLLLLRGTDKLRDGGFAYPKSASLKDAYKTDGVVSGLGGKFADQLFNAFDTEAYKVESTPLEGNTGGGGWVRYYNNVYSMERLSVLQQQVSLLKPNVLILGVPSVHDHIARRNATMIAVRLPPSPMFPLCGVCPFFRLLPSVCVALCVSVYHPLCTHIAVQRQMGTWAETVVKEGTRVIYLSINVQDEAKKPKPVKKQSREWSLKFIRAVSEELRSKPGVEFLDASSMTDNHLHGNVLSGDGTHVWGFVDVMKAKLVLSALCSAQ